LFKVGAISPHFQKDNWEYRVNGVSNCSYLIPYFSDKLNSNKKNSFILWKEIRIRLINGEHLITETRAELKSQVKIINKK
jgi:hypothetical protein